MLITMRPSFTAKRFYEQRLHGETNIIPQRPPAALLYRFLPVHEVFVLWAAELHSTMSQMSDCRVKPFVANFLLICKLFSSGKDLSEHQPVHICGFDHQGHEKTGGQGVWWRVGSWLS